MLKRIPLNIGKLFLPVSGGIFKFDQYCNWSVKFSVENNHSLVNKPITICTFKMEVRTILIDTIQKESYERLNYNKNRLSHDKLRQPILSFIYVYFCNFISLLFLHPLYYRVYMIFNDCKEQLYFVRMASKLPTIT